MKKKICNMLMLIALCLITTGCGVNDETQTKNSKESVQQEIVKFVNEDLSSVVVYKEAAVQTYNSYFLSDSVEQDSFLSELNAAAIPNIEEYIKQLEELDISSTEVMELRDLLLLEAKVQKEALELTSKAIEEGDAEKLKQVESLISQAGEYRTEYETKLKEFCDQYNIVIQK